MSVVPSSDLRNLNSRGDAVRLRHQLMVLVVLPLGFICLGLAGFVARAQNPNCASLKKRIDDATHAYQTALTQSQIADKNFLDGEATVKKILSDLTANDKKRAQAEKDLVSAQRDKLRCERDPNLLPAGGCASVTQQAATAEKIITYAKANRYKLETELTAAEKKRAATRAAHAWAKMDLTIAQQQLDTVNRDYLAAGCGIENRNTER